MAVRDLVPDLESPVPHCKQGGVNSSRRRVRMRVVPAPLRSMLSIPKRLLCVPERRSDARDSSSDEA